MINGGGYGLEIPVKYRLYGQEKILQWLPKKLETVKKGYNVKFLNAWNKYHLKNIWQTAFYIPLL